MKGLAHVAAICLASAISFGTGLCLPAGTAQAQTANSTALGGSGGASFEDKCKPGDFLVGFDYVAGKALNVVTPVCVSIANGVWRGSPYKLHKWGKWDFNGHFGIGNPLRCPANQYVTSLHVWWDKYGIVHHFRMQCHNVARDKDYKDTTETAGGEFSAEGTSACTKGMFAIGAHGGYGALVDRIGLVCQTL
jgi:hypothetical protein